MIVRIRDGSHWQHAKQAITDVLDEVCADYVTQLRDAWEKAVRMYGLGQARIEPMVTIVLTDNWLE